MSERAAGPVERDQRQPGDDRRQGEGEIDQGVDRSLAAELIPHQDPGDDGAHNSVDEGHGQGAEHAQAESSQRLRRGDGLDEAIQAVLRRAHDDGGQRDQHQDAQVRA